MIVKAYEYLCEASEMQEPVPYYFNHADHLFFKKNKMWIDNPAVMYCWECSTRARGENIK
jgi:hypothetical protein